MSKIIPSFLAMGAFIFGPSLSMASSTEPETARPAVLEYDDFASVATGLRKHCVEPMLIQLKGEVIVYGAICQEAIHITPSEEAWRDFRQTLDRIGVWKWQKKYVNPQIVDGSGWRFRIEYSDRRLDSSGINEYPGPDGSPAGSTEQGLTFVALRHALDKLLGKTIHKNNPDQL